MAERILAVLAEPATIEGHVLTVRASVGVAAGPARDAGRLLRAADVAMYEAKQRGKGTVAVAGARDRRTDAESRLVPHRQG